MKKIDFPKTVDHDPREKKYALDQLHELIRRIEANEVVCMAWCAATLSARGKIFFGGLSPLNPLALGLVHTLGSAIEHELLPHAVLGFEKRAPKLDLLQTEKVTPLRPRRAKRKTTT